MFMRYSSHTLTEWVILLRNANILYTFEIYIQLIFLLTPNPGRYYFVKKNSNRPRCKEKNQTVYKSQLCIKHWRLFSNEFHGFPFFFNFQKFIFHHFIASFYTLLFPAGCAWGQRERETETCTKRRGRETRSQSQSVVITSSCKHGPSLHSARSYGREDSHAQPPSYRPPNTSDS